MDIGDGDIQSRSSQEVTVKLGWICRELRWGKRQSQDYKLHDFMYISFLEWHSCRSGEQMNGFQGISVLSGNECVPRKAKCGILWWWKYSESWLYQCQYPDCDIVVQLFKILPLGEIWERVHGSLYILL